MHRLMSLVQELRRRPGMFLPDARYTSLVAFIEGFALGADEVSLRGFSTWLAHRAGMDSSSLHWSVLIAGTVQPAFLECDDAIDALAPHEEVQASQELLSALADYLATQMSER